MDDTGEKTISDETGPGTVPGDPAHQAMREAAATVGRTPPTLAETEAELLEKASAFIDSWDGNAKKGKNDPVAFARVDGLKLAELRTLLNEYRKAAVRALRK